MLWVFLAGVITTIVIAALVVACVVFALKKNYLTILSTPSSKAVSSLKASPEVMQKPISAPLKSMTPYERSLEDGKEIRERVEYLLK